MDARIPVAALAVAALSQRHDALRKANYVRARRSELKRDLKRRKVHVADVLLTPPDYLGTTQVRDVLLASPGIGRVKGDRLLDKAEISHNKTVGRLTPRQREQLVRLLRA